MRVRFVLASAALAAIFCSLLSHAALPVQPITPVGRWQDATLDQYRQHLQALVPLVQACAAARDIKACDPTLVGPDDRIPLAANGSERRLVRFGWLRVLFSRAQDKDTPDTPPPTPPFTQRTPPKDSAQPAPPTTSQLLLDAQARLAQDLIQANGAPAVPQPHAAEREAMKQVLAGRDFRDLAEPSARDSLLERLGNWLNHLFESASRFGERSAWIGRVLVWGFILAVCVGLVWSLMQLERRWRIRLVPEDFGPAAGAASARPWQKWLEDARAAAAAGQWREAIHFVYWASISRLESKRLWPADRARTPREYLALVATDDPRRPSLAKLTGSFERVWYGGRGAAESDYRQAEALATALIAGNTPATGGGQ